MRSRKGIPSAPADSGVQPWIATMSPASEGDRLGSDAGNDIGRDWRPAPRSPIRIGNAEGASGLLSSGMRSRRAPTTKRMPTSLAATCARTTPASVLRSVSAIADETELGGAQHQLLGVRAAAQEREIAGDLQLGVGGHRRLWLSGGIQPNRPCRYQRGMATPARYRPSRNSQKRPPSVSSIAK